ncbi:hypothetical protein [Treponema endosymbiont of Eucomonympha sp.]|uniref:hypothetical protein n=1 Tax=Treponema endosymbiont of Eucomonympha sp. TaxID=1580831 RepID=UPI000AF33F75|nr:hypothetical protein [Treponema endosymbiont of Eucomonympha sp.]
MNEIPHSKLWNISLKTSSAPSNVGEESLYATQSSPFPSPLLFISGVFPLYPPSSPHYLAFEGFSLMFIQPAQTFASLAFPYGERPNLQ